MLHHVMMRHPLVIHYLRLTSESRQRRRILLHVTPNEDATLVSFIQYLFTLNKYNEVLL